MVEVLLARKGHTAEDFDYFKAPTFVSTTASWDSSKSESSNLLVYFSLKPPHLLCVTFNKREASNIIKQMEL